MERVNFRTPIKKNRWYTLAAARIRKGELTYAVFIVENESDICRLGHAIRAWRQANRFYRLPPQASSLWSAKNFPKPPGNSSEMKKIPWLKIGHNLSETAFMISFLLLKNIVAQKEQTVTNQIQEFDR